MVMSQRKLIEVMGQPSGAQAGSAAFPGKASAAEAEADGERPLKRPGVLLGLLDPAVNCRASSPLGKPRERGSFGLFHCRVMIPVAGKMYLPRQCEQTRRSCLNSR
jgi:hypothetical protein